MHKAVTVSARIDLRPFLAVLKSYQIWHHVTEESGQLVLWAQDETQARMIADAFDQWQAGALNIPHSQQFADANKNTDLVPVRSMMQGFINALWLAPVTVLVILACVAVALISDLGSDLQSVYGLLFPDVAAPGQFPLLALVSGLDSFSLWLRTLTPVLLHSGAVHLIFNMLWFWFFGRMMEPVLGKMIYLLAIVLMAFGGNVVQYLWSGSVLFGGMSGVIYGQIGLIWMWQSLKPYTALRLPLPMIMMFIVALVVMEVLSLSEVLAVATAAHVGGLLTGMLCGLALGIFYKSERYGR